MKTLEELEKYHIKGIDCSHFINGEFKSSINEEVFDNINSANQKVIGTVPLGGYNEVDEAVKSARQSLKGEWSKKSTAERSQILRKIGDLIMERCDELAILESLDTGKPLWLSKKIDVPRAAHNFYFFADYITSLGTEAFQMEDEAINYSVRKPVGVVGVISPWNLPLLLSTWKIAPCLAAGNTAVVKPAELTPMTVTVLAEIMKDAGVPDGVFNVVHGYGPDSAGEAITKHPEVDAITFTGETTTGKAIMRNAADSLKKLSFELGGKNPNIIFASADIDDSVETTLKSSFINQGQVCLCGSRIYVEEKAYDEFLEKFVAATKKLKVGDPFERETNVGPLVGSEHYEKVTSYIELAKEEGGTIVTGGKAPEGLEDGNYLEPTIITGLDKDCRVINEEIFGPVVTITTFREEEEVIELANDTDYGLSATLWCGETKQAHRVAQRLEAGIIWVNTWFLRDLRTPFGGMKQSGIGREGGEHGFEFYSELSNICLKL